MKFHFKIFFVLMMMLGISSTPWAQTAVQSEPKIESKTSSSIGTTIGSSAGTSTGSSSAASTVEQKVKPIKVVASFSILADMVKQVGGDAVEVVSMVGYGADAHVFSPTPADVRQIAQAQWVVTNGLGFEGWVDRLISASGYKGPVLVASKGVTALAEDHESAKSVESHDKHSESHQASHNDSHNESHNKNPNTNADSKKHTHGHRHHDDDQDPHAWQSLSNAKIYVENIRAGLVQLLPESRAAIDQRASDYQARIDALDEYTHQAFNQIPLANRRVMTTHDAFGYFAASYQIEFLSIQGWSTDREPSAAQVGQLIRQIRQDRIKALFFEHLADTRLVERIADETGAKLGGTLYVDALTAPGTPADTYLKMFALNVETILKALR
jgi:zinc/manganese transport system substrate-binding protein